MNKNKKIVVIILITIILTILGLLITLVIKGIPMTEENIVNKLTSMGEEIYINYYYPELSKDKTEEEVTNYLKQFDKIGLKFNLTELEKYNETFKKNISEFKSRDKSCNKNNSMVIIYPQSPYLSTSFNIEIKLDCGFKK